MIEREPATDFDDETGKVVPVSPFERPVAPQDPVTVTGPGRATAPPAGPFATPPAKDGEPFLANPLKLEATGSGAGHVSRADFARAGVALASVYGLLQMAQPMILQALTALGPDGHPFVRHGELFADAFSACFAAAVAIAHVITAYARDNRPREGPGPARVP